MNCQTYEIYTDGELNPYNLPTVAFTAGETQTLIINLYQNGDPVTIDTSNCVIKFAIIHHLYRNYDGAPLLYFTSQASSDNGSTITAGDNQSGSYITVTLASNDTIMLGGKYIYQIFISDSSAVSEPVGQGFFYITPNIIRSLDNN